MARLTPLLIVLLYVFPGMVLAAEAENLEQGMVNPGYEEKPDWFKESFLDIREDVTEAKEGGRQLMLYFYQDGCPYCAKLLQDNFGNRDITATTRQYFDTIAINIWGDREVTDLSGKQVTEKQFATDLRVQFTPTLVFLDQNGKVLTRLNGYYPTHKFAAILDYLGNRNLREQSFSEYYASLDPEPASGKLHKETFMLPEPLNLAANRKDADRPLLVLFEQQQCKACDELHEDIMRRPAIAASLSAFDVALVDIWSREKLITPDGRELEARDWARQLNSQYTPSLVFFDTQGKEVFRSEAYLKSFHTNAVLDYVSTGAYRYQPNFQRFIQRRADIMESLGLHVDLMQ